MLKSEHDQEKTQRHCVEELQNTNSHNTSGRQLKWSNQPILSHQDGCKTRKDTKYYITKQWQNTEPPTNRATNKNRIPHINTD